jgi:hypothetical protein
MTIFMRNEPDLVHATGCKQPTLRQHENVRNIGQGETPRRKYNRLNRSSVYTAAVV